MSMHRHRVLIIDDEKSIHEDFALCLRRRGAVVDESLDEAASLLFDEDVVPIAAPPQAEFDLEFAEQGREGLKKLLDAIARNERFSLAFVDMRMPPGWDGIQTIQKLWHADPELQVVICTAYTDTAWDEITSQLGRTDSLLVLKKPFDAIEVAQLAAALTAKHELSQAKAMRLADLETVVAERTQELVRARDVAESAATMKTDFLAAMSHAIRTPLSGIMGILDCLGPDQCNVDPDVRGQLDLMHTAADALLALINNVMDLSKLEAGEFELANEAFDVCELVQSVVQLYAASARTRGLRMPLSVDRGMPRWTRGDAPRIRQVLANLLSNALESTRVGEIAIGVAMLPQQVGAPSTHRTLELTVRDTGAGVPADKLGGIFAGASVTTEHANYRGAGLGLGIARQLAEAMDGTIKVHSRVGAGSVFVATLRLELAPTHAKSRPNAAQQHALEGIRVLLVEDDPVNQLVCSKILDLLSCEVTVAGDGVAGLLALNDREFDVVLLDCRMPVMDGYEMVRRVRASGEAWSAVPIIALTAEALGGDRDRCLAAGMDAHVTKPIRRVGLGVAIRAALAAKQAA